MQYHKYIYVYQTICEVNGKSYIGVHGTNKLDDGYIGCGIVNQNSANENSAFHNAVRKYGYGSFRKYILSFYDTYEEALKEEAYLVDKVWVKKRNNYNLAVGGRGSTLEWMTEEQRRLHRQKYVGEKNHRYGKKAHNTRRVLQYDFSNNLINTFNSITAAANSINEAPTNIAKCCIGKYGMCSGYIFRYESYTDIEKEKLQLNLKKRFRIYNQDGTWTMAEGVARPTVVRKGFKHSKEARERMSLARIGKKRKPHSEETKRKIGLANSKKNKKCPTI